MPSQSYTMMMMMMRNVYYMFRIKVYGAEDFNSWVLLYYKGLCYRHHKIYTHALVYFLFQSKKLFRCCHAYRMLCNKWQTTILFISTTNNYTTCLFRKIFVVFDSAKNDLKCDFLRKPLNNLRANGITSWINFSGHHACYFYLKP